MRHHEEQTRWVEGRQRPLRATGHSGMCPALGGNPRDCNCGWVKDIISGEFPQAHVKVT